MKRSRHSRRSFTPALMSVVLLWDSARAAAPISAIPHRYPPCFQEQALAGRSLTALNPLNPHPASAATLRRPPASLFNEYGFSKFLGNVIKYLLETGGKLTIPYEEVRRLMTPVRVIDTTGAFRRDNGKMEWFSIWRIVASFPGKGGLRATLEAVLADIFALHIDMRIKLNHLLKIAGLEPWGAKGGSPINLKRLTTAEKARWMRAWVKGAMDQVWDNEHKVAFGPLFDSPAPDVGTSLPDINLMDYFADEVNRWLLNPEHADAVLLVLDRDDPILADDLRKLQESHRDRRVDFDEAGSQLELPHVNRILQLRKSGELKSLRLLACVTGKTAPDAGMLESLYGWIGRHVGWKHVPDQVPFGHGGIRGRGNATGMGLAFAVLETMKLLNVISGKTLAGITVAIEGFGNVGYGAAVAFNQLKATVVAIKEFDSVKRESFALFRESGLTPPMVEHMKAYKDFHDTLVGYEDTSFARRHGILKISSDRFWQLEVKVLAPCAQENTITPEIAEMIRAQFVAEGANGPTTAEADAVLARRKIFVIPDVIANAGGVIVSLMEMLQNMEINGLPWSMKEVYLELHQLITMRLKELFEEIKKDSEMTLRDAAHKIWMEDIRTDSKPPEFENVLTHAA